jgi:hypothetical protein
MARVRIDGERGHGPRIGGPRGQNPRNRALIHAAFGCL